jgi:hypothetical protein
MQLDLSKVDSKGAEYIFHIDQVSALYKIAKKIKNKIMLHTCL